LLPIDARRFSSHAARKAGYNRANRNLHPISEAYMSDAVPQATSAPLSEGQRIVDTFVAPSKTFADVLRKSSWWGPLLLMIVVSIAF